MFLIIRALLVVDWLLLLAFPLVDAVSRFVAPPVTSLSVLPIVVDVLKTTSLDLACFSLGVEPATNGVVSGGLLHIQA